MNTNANVTILFRPVDPQELELIEGSDFLEFPPRLEGQPFFYPVLNQEYAIQFDVKTVGNATHKECWIPADNLPEFNRNIVGRIEVIAEFRQPPEQTNRSK